MTECTLDLLKNNMGLDIYPLAGKNQVGPRVVRIQHGNFDFLFGKYWHGPKFFLRLFSALMLSALYHHENMISYCVGLRTLNRWFVSLVPTSL